jgi:hypothetical protein
MNAMFVLFVAKYDSSEDLQLDQLMEGKLKDTTSIENAFKSQYYIKALKTWLPFLNKRGYLDGLLPNASMTPFCTNLIQEMMAQAGIPAGPETPESVIPLRIEE